MPEIRPDKVAIKHRVSEWMDRELLLEQEVELPSELIGLSVKGFLLSDDRRACITIEPVKEPDDA